MKIEVGKLFTMVKRSEPKRYSCVVVRKVDGVPDLYELEILLNTKFTMGYYNPITSTFYYSDMRPSTEWSIVPYDGSVKPTNSLSCDCGGYVTHGSYAKEFHSRWCSSQTKTGAG